LKPVLGLVGKEGDEPEVDLEAIEAKVAEGRDKFIAYLKDQTGKTERALGNLLDQATDAEKLRKLRVVCGDDHDLFERVKPFANLIREDSFGNVQVYPEGALYATVGSDRRSTGTHYTPRTLTEEVVKYALEPLVYVGPAEGLPEEEWTLKDAKAIVDLKVCDMAMGSGAFLVAACRFLSIKLVEAWAVAEEKAARRLGFSAEGHFFTHRADDDHHAKSPGTYVTTPYGDIAVADPNQELIPNDAEERLALARRIVADRCLYGVDRNAMAVEMAKLSLWLTTLRKDRPFTFLDHALRHGDSLLGVTERQLEMFSMDTSGQSKALLLPWVPEFADRVRNLRQQIARIPSHDPEAIRRKQRLFDQVRELEKPLKFAADALVACELSEGNARDKTARRAVIQATLTEVPAGERLRSTYKELTGRPTFHWELEYPDVFAEERGGFDAIVGNPPFLGGRKISSVLGDDYRTYIGKQVAGGRRASADLVAFFLLRACGLQTRAVSLITTNTIAQTDTRELGLEHVLANGYAATRALSSMPWPGDANLEVAVIWLYRGSFEGKRLLNGTEVEHISSFLSSETEAITAPVRLLINMGRAFLGSCVQGEGFVLDVGEALQLLADPGNHDVVFPYVSGQDINSRPDHSPSRFVINFHEWTIEEASRYPECLRILTERVKPYRDTLTKQVHEPDYWKFWDKRLECYRAIENQEHVFARSRVSNLNSIAMLPTGIVYSDAVVVFGTSKLSAFAQLQSSIHTAWLETYSSSMRTDTRYTVSDCFDTFPFATGEFDAPLESLEEVGGRYYRLRDELCLQLDQGLTKLYNGFNDESDDRYGSLRNLHVELDTLVTAAYGWEDITLGHGFHDTLKGVRFTISPEARKEVLRRLLKLNHERHAEEVAAGLHDKKGKKSTGAKVATSDASTSTSTRGRKPNPNTVAEPRATYTPTPAANLFDTQLTLGEVE
jgi:hypothetical protein